MTDAALLLILAIGQLLAALAIRSQRKDIRKLAALGGDQARLLQQMLGQPVARNPEHVEVEQTEQTLDLTWLGPRPDYTHVKVTTTCPPDDWWMKARRGDQLTLTVTAVKQDVART